MNYAWADHKIFGSPEGAILLGVDHASIFFVDTETRDVISRWEETHSVDLDASPQADREVLEGLRDARILVPVGQSCKTGFVRFDPGTIPLSTLVLEVAQDCNLRCTYCYAGGGSYGKPGRLIDHELARQAVRTLIDRSGERETVTLILFGGEPLLNLPALKAAAEEAEIRGNEAGKKVILSLTTNGTLLGSEAIDFIKRYRVTVSVSMDGPPDLHNANRPTLTGEGSYQSIATNLARLLAESPAPVAARVTLIPEQWSQTEAVFDHLMEIGFHEVGIAPASPIRHDLLPDERHEEALLLGFAAMAKRFLVMASQGRVLPFSNLIDLLARLHKGQTKSVSCGAGLGYLAVDAVGDYYLCHRLAGDSAFRVGTLATGPEPETIRTVLDQVTAGLDMLCADCWARTLCSGGCHYENNLRGSHLGLPAGSSCNFILSWLQVGIETYAELRRGKCEQILKHFEKRVAC
ncbi:MAG: radical SAM protein [Desulfuromonadaceae bacterium]